MRPRPCAMTRGSRLCVRTTALLCRAPADLLAWMVQRVLAVSLAPCCLRAVGAQEAQGEHVSRPDPVLGRLVTHGYSQGCHWPGRVTSHRALPVPARVGVNEEFISCCFRGGRLWGVSIRSSMEPPGRPGLSGLIGRASRAGRVGVPEPCSPKAAPLARSRVFRRPWSFHTTF